MNAPVSAIYEGVVQHERTKPARHRFRYRVYQTLLDLDELPELERRIPFFSHNRANLVSFFDTDHMGDEPRPVREKLARWLAARGVRVTGRVFTLTNLRVLGYTFNPVTYHYVNDARERLDCVVAEIHNTFGESYAYLLTRRADAGEEIRTGSIPKVFHISPFISMDASYEWTLTPPGDTLRVHIDEKENGEPFFTASFAARRRPLTAGTLARALLAHPHMPLHVITSIHWQALKLWLKRVPVFHKPEPPAGVLTRRGPAAAPTLDSRRNA